MGYQGWTAPIAPTPTYDATALATSTALTDVSPAPQYTVPAGAAYPGKSWRFYGAGKFSNTGTPTLLLGIYWGGVAGTKLCAIGATTTTTGATNWPFRVEGIITCRDIGSGTAGSLIASGRAYLGTSLTAFTTIPMDNAAIAPVGVDTTAAKTITLGAQWGTSSASNTLTVVQWVIEDVG